VKHRKTLTFATLGLLGAGVAPVPAMAQVDPPPQESGKQWEFDSALLYYAEADGRVQAIEPVIHATYDFGDERVAGVKLVLDSLTGASPNGAAPASSAQTFTRPSGRGTYTAAPGELPLDDSFKDTRVAVSGDYQRPVGQDGKLGFGLNASTEYDFLSAGASARYSRDFNQHNTTLSAGLGYESDQSKPVGGAPEPLSPVPPPGPRAYASSESRGVTDAIVGVTQVLDPHSFVQVNYSLSASSGYHTDPYKMLSVVGADGEPLRYVYESRPDSRTKHAVFARYKRFVLDRHVLDVSYRYLTDDWQVNSSTIDALYRWNFSDRNYLEPHLRWYSQREADFYRAALYDGEEATVEDASADPRLGAFTATTVGLKYGHTMANGHAWNVRLEYYRQTGDTAGVPAAAAAGLSKFDLEPDLTATMFSFGYRFKW